MAIHAHTPPDVPLNLHEVPLELHEDARAAFKAGDWQAFVHCAAGGNELCLVCDNMAPLAGAGLYEPALLYALTGPRMNHHGWSLEVLRFMLDRADRARLLAAGSPLPGPGPFTLYRGVAGRAPARKVRGLHWTTNPAIAAWFSQRMSALHDPAVVVATVPADAIHAYVADRTEDDFLVMLPPSVRPRRLTADELAARLAYAPSWPSRGQATTGA